MATRVPFEVGCCLITHRLTEDTPSA